ESQCDDTTKDKYLAMSGASSKAWTTDLAARVKKLASGILAGEETVLRKMSKINLNVVTGGASCSNATLLGLTDLSSSYLDAASKSKVSAGSCRLVYGKA
ncbi:unnamed protein product, partial [Polarella glacialis]